MNVRNVPLVIAFGALLFIRASSDDDDDDEVCFEELGCIPLYECPQRPLHPPPDDRDKINTTFRFYTREGTSNHTRVPAIEIQPETLETVAFKDDKLTMMIVHGWIDSTAAEKWLAELRDALLRHGDYNVILVEWAGGNGPPYYQAVVNTQLVGAEIGLLHRIVGWYDESHVETPIQEAFGVLPTSVHAFGHSLGGHIVGFAGKWLHGDLGRITALDPAEPLFQTCPPHSRLANTDAHFVEVVHTDSTPFAPPDGLGMAIAVGDVDYYPNGGLSMPGCNVAEGLGGLKGKTLLDIARKVALCNHMRAVEFTVDHIDSSARKSKCKPIAFPCDSFERFEKGLCTECGRNGTECGIMSLVGDEFYAPEHKTNETRRLFLKTNSRAPFCIFHYAIEIGIGRNILKARLLHILTASALPGSSPAAESKPPSPIKIQVNSKLGVSRSFDLLHKSDAEIKVGAVYHYLITSEDPLEDIVSVTITFQDPDVSKKSEIPLKYLKFTPMTVSTTFDFEPLSKYFCAPRTGVPRRIAVDLKEESCKIRLGPGNRITLV